MRIFVSFDYDNDRHYKYLLNSWAANSSIDFNFEDGSTGEINSWGISRVKAALTTKIKQADAILVLIGKHADDQHKDHAAIGYRNWQYFEIAQAKEYKKKIIAVKIDRENPTPALVYNSGASWAMSYNLESINNAIHKAIYGW